MHELQLAFWYLRLAQHIMLTRYHLAFEIVLCLLLLSPATVLDVLSRIWTLDFLKELLHFDKPCRTSDVFGCNQMVAVHVLSKLFMLCIVRYMYSA